MCKAHFCYNINMNFGKKFKEARVQANLTQKQIADKLHIHQSNVSDWENNISRPDYEKLIELSKIYDISIDDLLNSKF